MSLASLVANVIEDRDPDAVFIDSGAGAGVIDRLRQLGYDVTEVAFGGKATYPNLFVNKRAEMWWAVKEWLENGGSIPADTTLKAELATPTYTYDSVGRRARRVEGRDQEAPPGRRLARHRRRACADVRVRREQAAPSRGARTRPRQAERLRPIRRHGMTVPVISLRIRRLISR
jgi:hypothetical protein